MERRLNYAMIRLGTFYRCPWTNRILTGSEDDDKVLCGCGRTQPAGLGVRDIRPFEEPPGAHFKRFLPCATADEYIVQLEAQA